MEGDWSWAANRKPSVLLFSPTDLIQALHTCSSCQRIIHSTDRSISEACLENGACVDLIHFALHTRCTSSRSIHKINISTQSDIVCNILGWFTKTVECLVFIECWHASRKDHQTNIYVKKCTKLCVITRPCPSNFNRLKESIEFDGGIYCLTWLFALGYQYSGFLSSTNNTKGKN